MVSVDWEPAGPDAARAGRVPKAAICQRRPGFIVLLLPPWLSMSWRMALKRGQGADDNQAVDIASVDVIHAGGCVAACRLGLRRRLLPGVAEAADFGQERVAFLLDGEAGLAFQVAFLLGSEACLAF